MHSPINLTYHHKKHRKKHRLNRKKELEVALIIMSSVGPIASIPQIIKIHATQSAGDLSVVTWGIYILSALGWLAYGFTLRSKPLLINNAMWLTVYVFVMSGILLYG